jgi:hypothetical protein
MSRVANELSVDRSLAAARGRAAASFGDTRYLLRFAAVVVLYVASAKLGIELPCVHTEAEGR